MAPVSDRVAAAAKNAIDRLRVPSQLAPSEFFEPCDRVRQLFARLVNIEAPRRVAIVPSVSYAMAAVARNTPLDSRQNVVVIHEQFPSAIYTWQRACAAAGATLRTVPEPTTLDHYGPRWNDKIIESVDRDTAAVVLPEVHWAHGTRFDLARIARRAHACGARVIVDGTQSIGALPFDTAAIEPDVLICAGYKWLMGAYSIGLAYFSPSYDGGVPLEENWIARAGSDNFAGLVNYSRTYQPGAIRYDMGERSNFVLLPMLEAGLNQVLNWGPDVIQQYCVDVSAEAVPELQTLGCWVQPDTDRASHLFGVRAPGHVDMGLVRQSLERHHVSASVRGQAIRVAPHVYNDRQDMEAFVRALREIVAGETPA